MALPLPKLAFYGDDFTGATDTLATVARAGQTALLFLRVPTPELLAATGPLDCLGIAGAARAMRGSELEAELDPVGRFFAQLGAPVTHYKICSTFDSSPDIGSIGAAARILRRHLKTSFMPIVGGQPNLGRYCVFGNLFAAFETGGRVYRIDRHPTMSRHPVTPMHEADLCTHLARQGLEQITLLEYPCYDLSLGQFDIAVEHAIKCGPDGVLFDIGHASHLAVVGRAIWQRACEQPLLAIGSSSVAQALLAHWSEHSGQRAEYAAEAQVRADPVEGPVFVLSGSMSPVTARQVTAARAYHLAPLDLCVLMSEGSPQYDMLLADVIRMLSQGCHVLAYIPNDAREQHVPGPSPAALAKACGTFLARVLQSVRLRRVGISGGDTSSYAVKALDVWGLSYLAQIDPGVALCRMHSVQPHLSGVEIMLKGGQMGSESVFEKLLTPST